MKHFILIFDQGEPTCKHGELNEEEIQASKDGYLVVIDITNPATPKELRHDIVVSGRWEPLDEWNKKVEGE